MLYKKLEFFKISYLKNNFKKKIILLLFISCKETASNYLL